MLQEDPVLFQLYKDLVVSQVISAEEFWANRLSLNAGDNSAAPSKQDVGISAAFLVRSTSNLQDFRANKLRKVRVPHALYSHYTWMLYFPGSSTSLCYSKCKGEKKSFLLICNLKVLSV